MAIDVDALWDFERPELSERRFRSALSDASGDEALILETQIARTFGLRGDFVRAREHLAELEPRLQAASREVQVRYYLELGRTYASAAHPQEQLTTEARELARSAYLRAVELAHAAGLDGLAIDGLHMMTVVDPAPEDQLGWNRKAMDLMRSSSQPATKKWEGPLHNNTGYALHLLGRYEEALAEFQLALAARERDGTPQSIRIARWMIASTLRAAGRLQEALQIQLELESECDQAGEPDPYVFEELELLYRALGDSQRSEFYAARRSAAT